ncbi:MAG: rod shape-determining protein RodA [Candidatus Latescibacteria bacterium]|nr:rod shape-determining protein RodA [Candidatus Latescibacterota bacterium]
MRLLRETDTSLLWAVGAIVLLGITMVYSASSGAAEWKKQAIYAVLAGAALVAVIHIPNRLLYALAYPFYLVSLVSLVIVLLWGSGEDSSRWITFGPFSMQPSEFAKIATILTLAHYLGDRTVEQINHYKTLIGTMVIVLPPMALIVEQPDLGTAMTLAAILLPMFYWAGMNPLHLFVIIAPMLSVVCSFEPLWQGAAPFVFAAFVILSSLALHRFFARLWITLSMLGVNLAAGLATVYLWEHMLHDYQKARILTFLDPERDRLGSGWNIIQSKIAIGSGGLTGKGYLEGTQTKFEFLPASHTDFIFSVIGEELGFIGTMLVLSLFAFVIWRALNIAAGVTNRFYSLMAIGLVSLITFHVFVNIGMTIGVMPVTGIPLPFISYGGSALLTNCTAIGLLLHAHTYRHE